MRTAFVACALALLTPVLGPPAAAGAGQRVAVFPFDMVLPKSEEDFFTAQTGPSKEEQARLELARQELANRLAADDRYEIIDLGGLSQEIAAAAPLHACNGCEIDLAAKVKADLAVTSVIDKISETHLSLTVALIDVPNSRLVRNASVLIQGNTDEAWLHGVKWLTKNRLLAQEGGAQ
jgi:hypothetical protein